MTNFILPQVFIGGTGRSGTTILGKILAQREEIIQFQEPNLYQGVEGADGIIALLNGKIQIGQFHENLCGPIRKKIIHSLSYNYEDPAGCYSRDAVESVFHRAFSEGKDLQQSVSSLLEMIYGLAVSCYHGKIWIDKTPYTMQIVHRLDELFPNFRFIHIIRDPKDVACSYIPRKFGPGNVEEFIPWYRERMIRAFEMMQKLDDGKYLVLSLERLLETPIEVLRTLFSFIGIELENGELIELVKPLDLNKAHKARWRKEMTIDEALKVDQDCGSIFQLWSQLSV